MLLLHVHFNKHYAKLTAEVSLTDECFALLESVKEWLAFVFSFYPFPLQSVCVYHQLLTHFPSKPNSDWTKFGVLLEVILDRSILSNNDESFC